MSEDKPASVGEAFTETPEFQELSDAIDLFEEDKTGAVERVEVSIPKRYLTLLQFLENKSAEFDGRAPLSTDQMLSSVLLGYLESHHPDRSVSKNSRPYYLAAWNRLCDELSVPGEKISKTFDWPDADDIF